MRLPPASIRRRIGVAIGSGSAFSWRDSSSSTRSAKSPSSCSASWRWRGPSSSTAKTDCQRPSTSSPSSTSKVANPLTRSWRQWAWPLTGSSRAISTRREKSSCWYVASPGASRSSIDWKSRSSSGSFSLIASPRVVCSDCRWTRPVTSPARRISLRISSVRSMNWVAWLLSNRRRPETTLVSRERVHEHVAHGRRGRACGGGARKLLDRAGESDLHRLGRVVGEDARRSREAQVAHQQRRRRRGGAAKALELEADFDQRGREGETGLLVWFVQRDSVEIRAVRLGQPVVPQAFESRKLTVEDGRAHGTGSTSVLA